MRLLKMVLRASAIPLIITLLAYKYVRGDQLVVLFLNLEGGFLLAFTVKSSVGAYNNVREWFLWMFNKSLNYTSTVSYNFGFFYLGLLYFVGAQIMGVFK